MLTVFLILLFIAGVSAAVYVKYLRYPTVGQAEGVCVEVRTEYGRTDTGSGSRQMRGCDSRMYRPYVKYVWEGREYVAKSVCAYSQAKIFPGDRVRVLVNGGDKGLVKIVRS